MQMLDERTVSERTNAKVEHFRGLKHSSIQKIAYFEQEAVREHLHCRERERERDIIISHTISHYIVDAEQVTTPLSYMWTNI